MTNNNVIIKNHNDDLFCSSGQSVTPYGTIIAVATIAVTAIVAIP